MILSNLKYILFFLRGLFEYSCPNLYNKNQSLMVKKIVKDDNYAGFGENLATNMHAFGLIMRKN